MPHRQTLYLSIPNPDIVVSLEPEELAGFLLQFLNSLSGSEASYMDRSSTLYLSGLREYPPQYHTEITIAYTEAWMWLENEGFLIPVPNGPPGESRVLSRRARQLKNLPDFKDYRKGTLLPKELLHEIMVQKVWPKFIRGEYDAAVVQSFKEVEVAVRIAGGYPDDLVGTKLMRKAFDVTTGPLSDMSVIDAERQSLSDLFAGAIGSYKNPHSHRNVFVTSEEAAEMIILASHLLKIVDARAKTP